MSSPTGFLNRKKDITNNNSIIITNNSNNSQYIYYFTTFISKCLQVEREVSQKDKNHASKGDMKRKSLQDVLLLKNNKLIGGNSNSALRWLAKHHPIVNYFLVTAHPVFWYSLFNLSSPVIFRPNHKLLKYSR